MKKILLFALAALMAIPSFAQDGVKWEDGTFQEVLAKAKKNKKGPKLVFVDCFTSWCGPCKQMATKIFPTKEAGEYFNKNFVNAKFDMEKGEGIDLHNKYGIAAYPTFLILDADGNEIGRVVGGDDLEPFIAAVERAKDPNNSPNILIKKFEETYSMQDGLNYLDAVNAQYMNGKITDFFAQYYDKVENYIFQNSRYWDYAKSAISLSNPVLFDKITDNKESYDMIIGKATVDEALCQSIMNETISFLNGRSEIGAETMSKAAGLYRLIASGERDFNKKLLKAAEAYSNKDIEGLLSELDARMIAGTYGRYEYRMAYRILTSLKEIPVVEKARFVKEYREVLEQMMKETDAVWEEYKGVQIPERKSEGNVIPAMLMM